MAEAVAARCNAAITSHLDAGHKIPLDVGVVSEDVWQLVELPIERRTFSLPAEERWNLVFKDLHHRNENEVFGNLVVTLNKDHTPTVCSYQSSDLPKDIFKYANTG